MCIKKKDLALNNRQWLICHKTTQSQKPITYASLSVSKKFAYSKKVKLATLVEGDQKVPISIATTLRCRGALLLSLNCSTLPLIRTLYC